MKIDPHKHEERYLRWWEKATQNGIKGLSPQNEAILKQYLQDMENGFNVASSNRKGSRSYSRLHAIKTRIGLLMREFQNRNLTEITKISEEQLSNHFLEMRRGKIRKKNGKSYLSTKDYVRDFKAFWHWHQKTSKKKGIEIQDITTDLDTSGEKPKWVYMNENQVKSLIEGAKYEYKVLIWFLFDSGVRSPTELVNIKVSDFYNDFKELNIRQETSKTFGRRIKLMICSELIKTYIKEKGFKENDYLFDICPSVTNRYLKRLAKRKFGEKESLAGEKYSNLTMYDFRHISCCYWLPRYKSESALKYRFGWKKSDKIHYYSELLGMTDTISQEDMLVDVTMTEIEKKLEKSEKEKELLIEKQRTTDIQLSQVMELMKQLENKLRAGGIIG